MSWQAALTLAVPALIAVVGYAFTYANGLRLAARKDRLDRVTRQLSDFYGPLLALSSANAAAWKAFRRRYRPDMGFWNDPPPTQDDAAAWRLWMTTVFVPANRQMRDVVVNNADLLDEDDMPQVMLELCAHVAAYEPILLRWQDGDFSEHYVSLNFPGEDLQEYLSRCFRSLKAEQNKLLLRTVPRNARA
jgi:hypothetical protein